MLSTIQKVFKNEGLVYGYKFVYIFRAHSTREVRAHSLSLDEKKDTCFWEDKRHFFVSFILYS